MGTESVGDKRNRCRDKRLLAVVGLGMALFVSGFLLAVTSLSEPDSASAEGERSLSVETDAQGQSISLLTGLLLSLAGVVLATAAPAMFFIQARNGSS